MLFPRVLSTDAEKGFSQVYNVSGAAVSAGAAVVYDITAPDGVRVSAPATATLSLLVGVAAAAIADSAYGLVQVYGYNSQVYTTNATNQAVAAGDILIPVNAAGHFARSAASDGKTGFVYAGQSFATAATPAAAVKKAFIRCL